MECDFDVIVIGSGAGGAAFAHACASAGKSVLVIERGQPQIDAPDLDERASLIDKLPYDDRSVMTNGDPLRLYMGGVVGGSTAVFGGAMLRPGADDFHPGRHYGQRLTKQLWDWPVCYDVLKPWYDRAERLFRLTATRADSFEPLNSPGEGVVENVLPMAPVNQRMIEACRSMGLNPFRLPLAIDTSRCARCDSCAGYLCPNGARRSAAQLIAEAASEASVTIQTNSEVDCFTFSSAGEIDTVCVRDRGTDEIRQYRALCFALAAGAIGSPAILLKSGIDGPHIGRNYMMHYSPIAVGVFPRATGASSTFVKQVGIADYYYGTADCPHKMGLVQSLPAPGPLMLKKSGLQRWPDWALGALRTRMLPLAGIVEDLPDPRNRISVRDNGSISLLHEFSDFDRERGRSLSRAMCRILKQSGALLCRSRAFPSREHVAHQCGTLRFGTAPAHAAVDPDCRLFGQPKLFVVDGSVFPTSTGVGPSLTIAANALRAAHIALSAI